MSRPPGIVTTAGTALTKRAADHLHGRIVAVDRLDPTTRDLMLTLLARHFHGVDRETFDADLREKSCAILLEDGDGGLRGFSTLHVYRTPLRDGATILYSGDTIVDRGWWGSPALPRTWIRAVRRLVATAGGSPVYWFLLTSGFRTYRFLPVFFRTFVPACNGRASNDAALLSGLAEERFGSRFDPGTGIVRLARPQRLKDDLLSMADGRAIDPDVAYFLERNPGHARGDELACLTRLHDDNLTAAGLRMTRGGTRE